MITSSESLTGAGTLGNEMDPLDAEGLKLGALEITEDRYKKNVLTRRENSQAYFLLHHSTRNCMVVIAM